jgi:hypothetical protein
MSYIKTVIDWDGLADSVTKDVLSHGEKQDLFNARDKVDILEICDTMRAGDWQPTQDKIQSLDTFVRRELCVIIESHAGEEFWDRVGACIYC